MAKYKAVIEYDGTCYHGWQLQKGVPTIQGAMEQALERILDSPTRVHGAGRTDAGVHAEGQVAHFAANWRWTESELQKGWNALLPPDIVVKSLSRASDDFHARHSARSKTYVYSILNTRLRSALHRLHAWHVSHRLEVPKMEEASSILLGAHDFAAFGTPTDGTPSTVREILEVRCALDKASEMLTFAICGTGFLRYMVRSLVGTLVTVGAGKMNCDEFSEILASCDRSRAGRTAPPHGLSLQRVDYGLPEELF